MCGICGFAGAGTREDLRRMADTLQHRGPDTEGFWADEARGVFLGHRRLSIIDLGGGAQPMALPDESLVVVFNGEIYNHIELRKELIAQGYRFVTDHADTEVLLHGYRAWGDDLPNRLNGMWAFAIYDRAAGTVFLSRDRFGKKPLFYTLQDGTFAFASELTALKKHPRITATVSPRSLRKYFAYGYIPAPNSLYEGIHKLPGGWSMKVDLAARSLRTSRYWDFQIDPFEKIPKNPEEEWGAQIRELLRAAVRRRLMSDVPLGVFLSGGIDSSSIAAFAAQEIGSERLKTFSIGFDETSFDETEYAARMAKEIGTEHHVDRVSIEMARTLLPDIAAKLDEPMGDSSLLPTYLLCRGARKHVTVAVGGDGGDELFAGYDPFRALRWAKLYGSLMPKPVHKAVLLAMQRLPVSHRNISFDFKVKRTLRGLSHDAKLWNPVWLGPLSPGEIGELFREPVDIEDVYSEAIACWDESLQDNVVDRTLRFFTKLYMQDGILVKVDRASMMHSLEVRAPYLDIDLVNFARRIPYQYKLRHGQTKYILKKALEPVLPHDIIYRKKKGFGVPVGRWFQQGLLGVDPAKTRCGMDAEFVAKALAGHVAGKHDHRLFLWNYWMLQSFI